MYYSKNKKNPNKKSLYILIFLATALSLTLLLYFLEKSGKINLYESGRSTQLERASDQNQINYNPPTEQESESGDEQKENLTDSNEQQEKPNTANVVIVDANQYDQEIEIRAFVSNAVKDGTCKIVFEKGALKLEKTVNAFADASTTPCMNLVIPRAEFQEAGEWKVTVTYESTDLTGSNSTTLEVQ